MRAIDEQFLETPWYGSRQMARHLKRQGHAVGRKRRPRLMARMGLAAVYQRPRTSVPHPEHRIGPYLLRGPSIKRPNQVWCADLTYIPMRREPPEIFDTNEFIERRWRSLKCGGVYLNAFETAARRVPGSEAG